MGNYLIDSDCDNIQDMVLKTIKNRNIACLGLGYKLISSLHSQLELWNDGKCGLRLVEPAPRRE